MSRSAAPKGDDAETVRERSSPSARLVHNIVRKEGDEELGRAPAALFWSALAAGLGMGFSLIAEGLIRASLPEAEWRTLLTSFGYTIGFVIVILGRQQLFTETTLTAVLPVLEQPTLPHIWKLLRLWAIVLAANLLGALLVAWVLGTSQTFDPAVKEAFAAIGEEALRGSFWTIMLRAIFAGWLIALVVWLLPAAGDARLGVVLLLTYLVRLGGFAHIIAGSTEVLYLTVTGQLGWGAYLADYFTPTLVGNTLGGVALVALVNHGQVTSDND